jgi:hypothetical protein
MGVRTTVSTYMKVMALEAAIIAALWAFGQIFS